MGHVSQWFTDSFRQEFDRASERLGRFNLAIFGKTGVGKSTLINAIFGEQVAGTGIGEPVTKGSHLHLDKRGRLGIVDTEGLEVGRDDKKLIADLRKLIKATRRLPVAEQIHLAWYCVRPMDRRFEDSEADFIRELARLDIPVLLVFTQVPRDAEGRFHPDAVQMARHITELGLPIIGHPHMTNAARDPFTGQPPHGLMELLRASFRVTPEAVHAALASAQQIDPRAKAAVAQKAVTAAAASAAGVAAVPLPFADAAALVPIQLGMMARVAHLYDIPFDRAAMLAVASTSAATMGGRAAVTNLIKLIPGAGSIAGGVIGAGVASAFTLGMGRAWISVCERVAQGRFRTAQGVLDNDAVRTAFVSELKRLTPTIRT